LNNLLPGSLLSVSGPLKISAENFCIQELFETMLWQGKKQFFSELP